MNQETALRLQAWVDGELPPGQASEVAEGAMRDPAAQALVAELRNTRAALAEGEVPRPFAGSREFYWSKIERDIRRAEPVEADTPSSVSLARILRFLAPAGVLAAIALVLTAPALRSKPDASPVARAEIESPLEDVSSFTFRSESERMTVVWINIR
jgi:anti-sigma factor RsiW